MRLHRLLRLRLIALVSMALLFSQLAVAAYACPAVRAQQGHDPVAMAGMPCAEMAAAGVALDPEQPLLCQQHCQFGSTSPLAEPLPLVFVQATAWPPVLTLLLDESPPAGVAGWAAAERLRDRPPPLAHSIAHCCFRI